MANEKETSLVEDIFAGLSKPGSAMRQALIDAQRGYRVEGDYSDILSGDKVVTARDFIDDIEKRYGIDFTVGDKENQGTFDKAANFGLEVVTDIFTSPDSLIAGPTKLLSKAGALNKIADPVARKAAERAITGATFGALTTQPDDDIIDTLQATAVGAATFGIGPNALKFGARKANSTGTFLLNSAIEKANKNVIKNFNMSFTEALGKKAEFAERTKGLRKLHTDLQDEVLNDFELTLKEMGLNEQQIYGSVKDNGEKVLGKVDELRLALAQGESILIKERNETASFIRDFIDTKVARGMPPTLKGLRAEGLGFSSKADIDFFKGLEDGGKEIDKFDINKLATLSANKKAELRMAELIEDDNVFGALSEFADVNRKLAKQFNIDIKKQARELFEAGDIEGARKLEEQLFVPLAFHTVDFKALDEFASVSDEIGDIKLGPGQRLSSKVMKDLANTSFREEIVTGSHKYASMFANESEKEASKILRRVLENTDKSLGKTKNMGYIDILRSTELAPHEKGLAMLKTYDKFIDLMKTKHLATGSSWLVTNYVDNVMKAFVYGGNGTAIRTAIQIPAQAGSGLVKAVDDRFLGGTVNALSFGILENLSRQNTFSKLARAFNPNDLSKITYDDNMMDAAALFGAIDSNKFIDMRRSIGETAKERIQTGFIEGRAVSEKVLEQATKAGDDAFIPAMQDFFWDTVGKVGSATEGTARYIMFKDLVKAQLDAYPELAKVINNDDGLKKLMSDIGRRGEIELEARRWDQIIKRGDTSKRAANLLEKNRARGELIADAEEVFKIASAKTNDIFFDYDNVTAFEKHVMKRIFPYWTFFSRNFAQSLEHGFDAERIARTAKIIKPSQNLGRPLSQEERMKTPDWLLEKGARIMEDENGNITFGFQPNLSLFDAINSVQDFGGSTLSKLSTPLKLAGEIATNREAFGRDVPVLPTQDKPKKRVLESAFTMLPDDMLENLGIYRDKNGRLYTNNRLSAGVLKAEELLPTPQVLSQFARARREVLYKEKSAIEASQNLAPIFRTFDLSPEQAERQRGITERNIKTFEGGKDDVLSKGRSRRRRRRRRKKRRRK